MQRSLGRRVALRVRYLMLVAACSAPSRPLPIEGRASEAAERRPQLSITLDGEGGPYALAGACMTSSGEYWLIEIPSSDGECAAESRPPDDWVQLYLPRCGRTSCPVPEPGASFDVVISLTKHLELDDVGIPVRVHVTVLRHERPKLVLALERGRVADATYGRHTVNIGGEFAVHVDETARWP
jgi:hypothetical protein